MLNKYSTIQVKEAQSSFGYMHRQVWTHPALGTATYLHAAIALTDAVQDHALTVNPDFPRIVSVKGNASGITGNCVITGTDIRGNVITDTIALSGSSEVFGDVAFATVTNIHLPVETHAGTDTVSIGVGDKLGLDRCYSGNEAILGTVDGTVEGTLPVITYDSDEIEKNLVTYTTALANTKVYVLVAVATERTYKAPTTS